MSREFGEHKDHDPQLDAMLKTHFASELDPHLGRARLAFQAHVAYGNPPPRTRRPLRAHGWMIGVVGTALAASIAAVWAVPVLWRSTPTKPIAKDTSYVSQPLESWPQPTTSGGIPVVPAMKWEEVSAAVSCVSQNKGVLLIGNQTPARVVQQYETELRQFVCPADGVRVEIVVPRPQTTRLIELETH